jgi:hypothetical protein
LLTSAVIGIFLLWSAPFVPGSFASKPPVAIGAHGFLSTTGKIVKKFKNNEKYYIFFVLQVNAKKEQDWSVRVFLDGGAVNGLGGAATGPYSQLFGTEALTAATGSHNATIGLCVNSNCTSYSQVDTMLFNVP